MNLNRATPAVVRLNPEKWSEDVPVSITWDPSHLGDDNFTVAVLLARFSTSGITSHERELKS